MVSLMLVRLGLGRSVDTVTISVLMVLVPGVALTNAMREIMAGDINKTAGIQQAEAHCQPAHQGGQGVSHSAAEQGGEEGGGDAVAQQHLPRGVAAAGEGGFFLRGQIWD